MAKQEQITVVYTDDLTDELLGAEAVQTVHFALDGAGYEIDLSTDNAQRLRDDLSTWIGHARKSGARKATRSSTTARGRGSIDREHSMAMREWARKNGHNVSERGRIPSAVIEAYNQAH